MTGKIWIDLDNSPHVLFFAPIISKLEQRGFEVVLTARQAYQVCELADRHGLNYQKIGRHLGKNKVLKIVATFLRAALLSRVVLAGKPLLAVSHGSRSQQILAGVARLTSVMIYDYEHTTALKMFHPTWIMMPEVIPNQTIRFTKSKVFKYPGIKEDVYIPSFKPDPGILGELGISDQNIIVTFRPPATEAHYHNVESEQLFQVAVEHLGRNPDVRIIMLPRNARQRCAIAHEWRHLIADRKMIMPERVIDGPNLIWNSDFVISGGGTMNREAAALRVPVYSIFRGTMGSVDSHLIRERRLTPLNTPQEIPSKLAVEKRVKSEPREIMQSTVLDTIVNKLSEIAES